MLGCDKGRTGVDWVEHYLLDATVFDQLLAKSTSFKLPPRADGKWIEAYPTFRELLFFSTTRPSEISGIVAHLALGDPAWLLDTLTHYACSVVPPSYQALLDAQINS